MNVRCLLSQSKTDDKKAPFPGLFNSGGGIRTRDLRVMSPTSYQTAPPRGGLTMIATRRRFAEDLECLGWVRMSSSVTPSRRQGAWVEVEGISVPVDHYIDGRRVPSDE